MKVYVTFSSYGPSMKTSLIVESMDGYRDYKVIIFHITVPFNKFQKHSMCIRILTVRKFYSQKYEVLRY